MMKLVNITFLYIVVVLLNSCASPKTASDEKLTVAASIYPVADWVKNVGGDKVNMVCLLPPGASPHTFEPTPKIVRELTNAGVLFEIGRGLDEWGDKIVTAAAASKVQIVVLSTGLPELPAVEEESEVGQQGGMKFVDPHVWLDPSLAQKMVTKIAETLAQSQSQSAPYFRANAEKYNQQLAELNGWIEQQLAQLTQREFISFHGAFTYFAAHYKLKQAAVIELSPGKEPTMRHIAQMINTLKTMKKKVVFAEPQFSDKAATALAAEVKAPVDYLDPMGGANVVGRTNYISLLKYDTLQFKKYLQ